MGIRAATPSHGKRKKGARLHLEALEDRLVPSSTWYVTSTADTSTAVAGTGSPSGETASNCGTLPWCVSHAANGDSIYFDTGVFASGATITLTATLTISHYVTIDGSNGGAFTPSAAIVLSASLGSSPGDSPIDVTASSGTTTLEHLSMTGGVGTSGHGGGMLYFGQSTGTLAVDNCIVTDCTTGQRGGFVDTHSFIILNNDQISDCSCTDTTVSTSTENGGGAVALVSSSSSPYMQATNCIFTDDSAILGGGAIGSQTSPPAGDSNSVTDCTFVGCVNDDTVGGSVAPSFSDGSTYSTSGTNGGSSDFIIGQINKLQVTAQGSPAPTYTMTYLGSSTLPDDLSFSSSGDLSSTSSIAAGGPYTLVVIATNSISSATQTITLSITTSSGFHGFGGGAANDTDGTGTSGTAGPQGGGAIEVSGGTLVVTGCIFGTSAGGGNSAIGSNNEGGGAVYVGGGDPSFTNCTFYLNSTNTSGGAVNVAGSGTNPVFTNCQFTDNSTTGTGTGINGGAVDVASGTPTFNQCTFNGNATTGTGGAVEVGGGTLTITNCNFLAGNSSGSSGSAIYTQADAVVENTTITGSSASVSGAGIYAAGNLTILNSYLTNNQAPKGAAVYVSTGIAAILNTTFDGNTASSSGGAIYSQGSDLSIVNDTITSNSAGTGAGVEMDSASGVVLLNDIIAGNSGSNPDVDNSSAGTLTVNNSLIGNASGNSLTNGTNGNIVDPSSTGMTTLGQNGASPYPLAQGSSLADPVTAGDDQTYDQSIPLSPGSAGVGTGTSITTLNTAVSAGATTIVVAGDLTASNLVALPPLSGQSTDAPYFTIEFVSGGVASDPVQVESINGNTLTLVSGTIAAHSAGVAIDLISDEVHELTTNPAYPNMGALEISNVPATSLSFTTLPSSAVSINTNFTVVVTAYNNSAAASHFAFPVTLTLSGLGTVIGPVNAVNGVATFTVSIATPGTYTLTASSVGLTATSSSFVVSPPVGLLLFTPSPAAEPPATTAAGATFSTTVEVETAAGVPVGAGAVVTLHISSNTLNGPGGESATSTTSTITGTTNSSSVVTFSNLYVGPAGTYTITASATDSAEGASWVASGTSTSFTVTAGPLAQLVFATQPATSLAGFVMNTVAVEAEDTYGNPIANASINLAISSPGTINAGTTTQTSGTNGVAFFPGLIVDTTGTFTLGASVTSPNVTGTSASFVVNPGPPIVASLNPATDTTSGGITVTIHGVNFLGTTAVSFGGTAATSFNIVSSSEITAVDPAHLAGIVNITVTSPYGTSATATADQFTYVAQPPTVASVSPSSGTTNGGTTVVITGTNLFGTTAVLFGSTPAASFVVNSPTQITAVTPSESVGIVDVTATTAGGTSQTSSSDDYTFLPPAVTAISPGSGTTSGGTTVIITGTNFAGISQVSFGGTPAVSVTVNSLTQITAVDPAHIQNIVDVTVTNAGATSATSTLDRFSYIAPVPVVTAVAPAIGPTSGGNTVFITGTGFFGATAVDFGGTAATSYTVNSPTQITAIVPAGSAGSVDVTVTTAGGTSSTSPADQYEYAPPPTVTLLNPKSGPSAGGTTVIITGTVFVDVSTVYFGSTPATSFIVNSATQITAIDPAQTGPTQVDVTVTAIGGTSSDVSTDLFTYQPSVTGLSPASGTSSGGLTVTISGTNLQSASAVMFGNTPAASFTMVSATQITAVTPFHTSGIVNVTVITVGGTSPVVAADQFTYVPGQPSVASVSPDTGSTNGAATVTITGTNFFAATSVFFGSSAALSFTVNSPTQITATSPPFEQGVVNVTVTTAGGTSPIFSADQFSYQASQPAVGSISVSGGSTNGGTTVTITGTNLFAATAVLFGSVKASNFMAVSPTEVTVTSPAEVPGTVDITVATAGGTSPTSASDLFTYTAVPPTLTSINPNMGGTSGGTLVTITGTNLASTTGVSFGGIAAISFKVLSNTQVEATSPPQGVETVDILVTTTGGSTTPTLADEFTYVTAPVVAGLSVSGGSTAGGYIVTITGSNFAGTSAVSFGNIAATNFTVVSSNQITAVAPPHAADPVAVTVTNNGMTSVTNSTVDQFLYVTPASVTGLSQTTGSTAGGYTVNIVGSNFTTASTVSFGSVPATSFTVQSSTQIVATVPTQSAGTVAVTVTTLAGTTPTSVADNFIYVAPPTVTNLNPAAGPITGGSFTIDGTNLSTVSTLNIGGSKASFTIVSGTEIMATAPAHAAGAVSVSVTNGGGTASGQFTYVTQPTVSGVSPGSGAGTGGTSVIITGSNFTGSSTVSFGGTAATGVTVVSTSEITATAPAHGAGVVDVTVANSGVMSATSLADQFTYILTDVWTGTTGNWDTPANWSAGVVPTAGYNVVINSASAAVNLLATDSVTVQSMTLSAGSITGAGALAVTGTLTWSGGSMTGSGSTTAGSLVVNPTAAVTLSGWTLTNTGTGSWQGGRFIENNGAQLLNQGTLTILGAGLSWTADSTSSIANSGTMTIASPLIVSGAGTLSETAGALTVSSPLSLANFSESAGSVNSKAMVSVAGQLTWTGGTMTGDPLDILRNFAAPADITLNGGLPYSAPSTSNVTLQTIEQEYDLSGSGTYSFNARGDEEKYLLSGNGSNPAGGGYYILLPNGNLFAWAGSMAATLAAAPAGSPGAAVYAYPYLLSGATPVGNLGLVSAGISGGTLTVADSSADGSSFLGTAQVAFASGGTAYNLLVTFNDSAPAWTAPGNQSVALPSATQTAALPLSSSDTAGNAVTYTAQVAGFSLIGIEQQYDLQTPPGGTYFYDARGGDEEYLLSGNGSNPAGGGYYIIVPGGNLYAFTGSLLSSETQGNFVGSLGAAAYANPTELIDAVPAYDPTAYATQQSFDLQATPNYMFNANGANDKTLVSGNGSNPAGSGYYILMPGGDLYAYDGNSLATTLENAPVAVLANFYYQNPAYLVSPVAPGSLTGVTANLGGGKLTVTDNSFLGTATIEVTASDGALTSTQSFQVTFADANSPTVAIDATDGNVTNTNTTTVAFTQTATATLTLSGGATYQSPTLGGYSPLLAIEQQYDLMAPPGATNYFLNARGAQEEYLVSGNGSNPAGSGYYILLPNGNMFAFVPDAKNDLLSTEAGAAISLGKAVYANPSELTLAAPAYNASAYDAEQSLDLQGPGDPNFFFNSRGYQEKYLVSDNGSNAAGAGYYILLPNGNLYAWVGDSMAASLANAPVATVPFAFYQNPNFLINAAAPGALQLVSQSPSSIQTTDVTAAISDNTLTVTDTADYLGSVTVYLTVTDGFLTTTQSFNVTFADVDPPTLTVNPSNVSESSNTAVTTTLTPSAGTNYTGLQIAGYSAMFNVEQQLDLMAPPGATNYFVNARGSGEKYLVSGNGSNSSGSGYYVLFPNGNLFAYAPDANSDLLNTEAGAPISLGTAVYNDPTELANAAPAYTPAAYAAEQSLDLQAPSGAANYYYNARGDEEKYLVSGNGANAVNGGFYVLMPNGNLYAWTGNSLTTSLAKAPAAVLPTGYYLNPGNLINAAEPGGLQVVTQTTTSVQTTDITASITGTTLTVTDTGDYIGTVLIYVTISDGAMTTTQPFQVTFN